MNDEMVVGKDLVYTMDCRKTMINNNLLVVGTSGCGKTVSITEPNLLATRRSSVVATFTKKKLVKDYWNICIEY